MTTTPAAGSPLIPKIWGVPAAFRNQPGEQVARRAEEHADQAAGQARAAHRLNVLAALFFPVVTATSLSGAGLSHGLEEFDRLNAPLPLLALVAGGVTLGAVLAAFVTRR